jgi:hypothetical protein
VILGEIAEGDDTDDEEEQELPAASWRSVTTILTRQVIADQTV